MCSRICDLTSHPSRPGSRTPGVDTRSLAEQPMSCLWAFVFSPARRGRRERLPPRVAGRSKREPVQVDERCRIVSPAHREGQRRPSGEGKPPGSYYNNDYGGDKNPVSGPEWLLLGPTALAPSFPSLPISKCLPPPPPPLCPLLSVFQPPSLSLSPSCCLPAPLYRVPSLVSLALPYPSLPARSPGPSPSGTKKRPCAELGGHALGT